MDVKNKILNFLKDNKIKFVDFSHEASGPSNLSKEVRSRHGFPNAVGAKALVLSVNFGGENKKNILAVVNSEKKLDKKKLKSALPNMKTFRFLTEKELFDLTTLVPGSVPPYGRPILDVEMFLVDSGLEKVSEIGFNCGELTHSVVLERGEFFKSIKPDMIVDLGE